MKSKDIKKLRLILGLSQERFARLVGVSLQTVRRWEYGLTKPLFIMDQKLKELQKNIGGVGMAEKKKREEKGAEFGFGGLFKGIGNLFDIVSKMAEEGKGEYTRTGEIKDLGEKVKGVYGFNVRIGAGGKPLIKQFGNIKATEKGPVVAEVREPMVDVFDEGKEFVIVAELPGVEEGDIHLKIKDNILDLSAEKGERKYKKETSLPAQVDAESMKSSYKNGVLEVRLNKR